MDHESLSIILDEDEFEKIIDDYIVGAKVKVLITTDAGVYEVSGVIDGFFI